MVERRISSGRAWRQALYAGAGTAVLAVIVGWPSQRVMLSVISPIAAGVVLVIVLVGVVFDTVGVAVTVADEAPFHAMSAKRLPGSRQALFLVRNADRVANLCNDIIGDLAGIVSGAAGAVLVLRLVTMYPGIDGAVAAMLMSALLASITVAGKAAGKVVALRSANEITLRVGRLLYVVDSTVSNLTFVQRSGRRKKGIR